MTDRLIEISKKEDKVTAVWHRWKEVFTEVMDDLFPLQEPMKSRAPQLHLEYRFYKQLVPAG